MSPRGAEKGGEITDERMWMCVFVCVRERVRVRIRDLCVFVCIYVKYWVLGHGGANRYEGITGQPL